MDENFKKELEKKLTKEQYNICVNKGTEKPFSGKFLDEKREGFFHCICCDEKLFSSEHKFDSGSGWPSFFKAVTEKTNSDLSFGMKRIEIVCPSCNSHLGHVFDDGPLPTKLRYCVNSASLTFKEK